MDKLKRNYFKESENGKIFLDNINKLSLATTVY